MKNQLTIFDWQFEKLHARSCELIEKTPNEKLFWQSYKINGSFPVNSCGAYILQSAGKVEQTFNGITAKLWDDPFEWTLPEALSTNSLILEYLAEVEETRRRGFAFFLETSASAENFQGRAFAIFRFFSNEKLLKS
jgi:hypothetical protein